MNIEVKKYKNINDCLASFYDCGVSELEALEGTFEMQWANGEKESWDTQKAISDIRERTCWGWVEDKTVFHFYVRGDATMTQVVKMFGHELGHTQRPFHRSLKEEQKADKYGNVAAAAYEMAKQAIGKTKIPDFCTEDGNCEECLRGDCLLDDKQICNNHL